MEVFVTTNYLGRNENDAAVVDFEHSGNHVLGVYASVQASCLCVVKVYEHRARWDVVEDFHTDVIDVETCLQKSNEFIKKYKIQHAFGNDMGRAVCKLKNSYSNDKSKQVSGFEVVGLNPEYMLFLVQGDLKNRIKFKQHLVDLWTQEIKVYDLTRLKNNEITCARVFALASIIHCAIPHPFCWAIDDIPDIIIDSKSGKIIAKEEIKLVELAGYKAIKQS